MSKSYLQPDKIDIQIEDTTEFNDVEQGIEIHREVFDKDIDDVSFDPVETEYEEENPEDDAFGYYD